MRPGPTFRILGALEGWDGDIPLRLGGALRERTLVMLLLEANRMVPVTRLVEAAWDNSPPASASHQIRKAVAELRHRIPGGPGLIRTDGPGYRATVTEDQLDLSQYRARVRRARRAIAEGRRAEAVDDLQSALDLWRGPVMAGFGGPVIDAASSALEEQHLAAAEQLFELRLAAGEAHGVVPELRALIRRHPLRETLRGQLMLALYRTGRQAAALEEYAQVRTLLADELGIDPSTALCELYENILRQSRELDLPSPRAAESVHPERATAASAAPGVSSTGATPAFPSTLPYDLRDFSGRADELAWITRAVEEAEGDKAHIIAIDGMGGSGKSALAVHVAHLLADRHPDGQLFLDLRGFTPGREPLSTAAAQDALLGCVGVPGEEMPADPAGRTALWQSLTSRRKLLIVLDNAADADQVRPLIPASPGCLTIITSRPRLVDLDGARWLSLNVLNEQDSAELISRTLGARRVAAEPEAAAELARLCGHLPLAVRISTARLRNRAQWTIQRLVDRLKDETRRLDELNSTGRSVAVVLRMSYQVMDEQQQFSFRLLGLHPGSSIDVQEAAALMGCDPMAAEEVLEFLLDVHLIEQQEPGWYHLHDLVRSFAGGLLGSAESIAAEEAALERLLDHYVLTTTGAVDAVYPVRARYPAFLPRGESAHGGFKDAEQAMAWLDLRRESLLSAVDLAHRHGFLRHAAYLPRELTFHAHIRNYFQDLHGASRAAVSAARELKEESLLQLCLMSLAAVRWRLGMFREAAACLREALAGARARGDLVVVATCLSHLGQSLNSLGEFDQALEHLEEAKRLRCELGMTESGVGTLNILSSVHIRLGNFAEAARTAERALEICAETGDHTDCVIALSCLALALSGLGRPQEALVRLDEALDHCEQWQEPANTALVLAQYADTLVVLDRAEEARGYAERAVVLAEKRETKLRQASVGNCVGRVHQALGEWSLARERHQRALDISTEISFRFEAAHALRGLAAVSRRLGESALAEEYGRRAADLFEEMGVPAVDVPQRSHH